MTALLRLTLVAATAVVAMGAACSKADQPRTATAAAGETTKPAAAAPADTSLLGRADAGRLAGNPDAKVWLIEISDFQCPFCKMWHDSTYAAIRREYVDNGKVRLAYVNMPLGSHKNAPAAAEAAMCAAVQDKFWPVHDELFHAQEAWARMADPVPAFAAMAEKAGVDMARWRTCMTEHQLRPLIAADAQRAESSGIRSTPSFIIGNQLVEGAYPTDTFRQVLDSALAQAARAGNAGK